MRGAFARQNVNDLVGGPDPERDNLAAGRDRYGPCCRRDGRWRRWWWLIIGATATASRQHAQDAAATNRFVEARSTSVASACMVTGWPCQRRSVNAYLVPIIELNFVDVTLRVIWSNGTPAFALTSDATLLNRSCPAEAQPPLSAARMPSGAPS